MSASRASAGGNDAAAPQGGGAERRSIEAYALPRMLDVAADAPVIVTALLVRELEQVARGQPVARVRHAARASTNPPVETLVRSPAPGLIVRCWATVGEMVGPGGAIVSMTSSDEVLLVARFRGEASSGLRRGRVVSARVGYDARILVPATILSVAGPSGAPGEVAGEGAFRVVLRLASAPMEALWPGARATVEI